MFSVREGDGAVDGRGSTGGSHQTAVGGGGHQAGGDTG